MKEVSSMITNGALEDILTKMGITMRVNGDKICVKELEKKS